jgi:hypothetical protein
VQVLHGSTVEGTFFGFFFSMEKIVEKLIFARRNVSEYATKVDSTPPVLQPLREK